MAQIGSVLPVRGLGNVESADVFEAVLWDLGGVITTGPFESFTRYEESRGLPAGFLRAVNAAEPDRNAWARLERSELSIAEFDAAFAAEARALGHDVPGSDVLPLLLGEVRPEMVRALDTLRAAGYRLACLTNNVADAAFGPSAVPDVVERFDVVVESSKIGVRKPEPRSYEIACELLGRGAAGMRVPRRSRHQPQARQGDGHDDDQGRRARRGIGASWPPCSASNWTDCAAEGPARPCPPVRATERQRGSGRQRPAWPGNAVNGNERNGDGAIGDLRPWSRRALHQGR